MDNNCEFNVLNNKDIILILIGDTKFGQYEIEKGKSIDICLKYLTTDDIVSISCTLGYSNLLKDNKLSRWRLMQKLFQYCDENKISNLLLSIFSKESVTKKYSDKGYKDKEIEIIYETILPNVIKKINEILSLGGKQLIIHNKKLTIKNSDLDISVSLPKLKSINREYITKKQNEALLSIETGAYDTAITQSRTVLEEVFIYLIENKGETASNKGSLNELFKQLKKLYGLHTDKKVNESFANLNSSITNIVNIISEIRNKYSDAHGVGEKRIFIDINHARFIVNISTSVAEFLLSIEDTYSIIKN